MSDEAARAGMSTATSFLQSLESLRLAQAIRHSLYLFPALEVIHLVALGLVFGTILVVDLRILGVASAERPFSRVSREMLRWTWGAFALAVLTGSLMFTTNARVYWDNTFFRIKMLLILLAGINMLVFQLSAGRSRQWDEARRAPTLGVACGVASITLWVLIIGAGRMIGFTTTGAAAKRAPAAPNIDFDSFLGAGTPGAAPSGAVPTPTPATIQELMDEQVNPAGELLFQSVRIVADERGRRLEAPATDAQWAQVRAKIDVLRRAREVLSSPGLKAAPPGFRAENPEVENEPGEVQQAVDAHRPDFDLRAQRLKQAADVAMKAAEARDPQALMSALDGIDKACESCHLHYFYPRDKRAQQQAREDGVE
jgi:hypothetical protein